MARRRTYTYRRRYYRRYRRISSNYFRVKAEASGVITWPTNIGQPIMKIAGVESPYVTFNQLLTATTYLESLQNMFSFYRINGVLIETVPHAKNIAGTSGVTGQSPTFIAPRAASDNAISYADLKSINSAILLNPCQQQRKYTKFYGYYGDYLSTSSAPAGVVAVGALENSTNSAGPKWDFKVTFYLTYKKSKI